MIIMTKYCSNCGSKLEDDAEFCDQCGASQKDTSFSTNNLIIIGLIALIIIILSAFLLMGGKAPSELEITSADTITPDEVFTVKLGGDGEGIANENVHFVFDDNGHPYEFDEETDSKGMASVRPNLDEGEYEVGCKFDGNDKFQESSAHMKLTVKENEPDYESYSYPRTFESTDLDGDGYVLLNDMNIAHTPKDIQYQMYADADDNHDGKLNEHEYYKFMYKLNYDKQSYGL